MSYAVETTEKLVKRLSDPNEEISASAVKEFSNFVTAQARELNREKFDEFIEEIHSTILKLVNNPNSIQAGLAAIDALIDVDYHESGGRKFTKLATFMKVCIKQAQSDPIMGKTAAVYGKLVSKQQAGINVESIEFELKRALEWLLDNTQQRHIAVLILTKLAQNVPTIFYTYLQTFLDSIWLALRDPNLHIREAAAEALKAALESVANRQTSLQEKYYEQILEESNKGFKANTVESIHGSLLGLGELLSAPGSFVQSQFKEVCDRICKYKDHRDKLIRRTVITLLPKLAASNPNMFVLNYRHMCINHLLSALRKDDRAVSFIATGKMAIALGTNVNPYLEAIMNMVRQGLSTRRPGYVEAMQCVSLLAQALGPGLQPHMGDILGLMFETGLSPTLTQCLTELVKHVPSYLPVIQERLLDLLSLVLSGKPYYHPGTPASFRKKKVVTQPVDSKKSALALQTLGSFGFSSHDLTEFVCDSVVGYLDDDLPMIRKEAALTCTKLIIPEGDTPPTGGHAAAVIAQVLEKLLNVGIADCDPSIRMTVLSALDSRFDHFLAQPENLRCLFLALNDEVFEIRELAITILGRQTKRNPAYVLPSLRTTLIQLLTELKVGRDNVNKEESALLLSLVVRASHQLVKPYVEPILEALYPRLSDSNPRVATRSLAALGELVQVGQEKNIKHYNNKLLTPIIATLQDQSSSTKRETALHTLGQLIKSTGYVITPFVAYPHLLDILLNEIKTEQQPSLRREVLKVLGIIGAIDPYKHYITQLKRPQSENSVLRLEEDDIPYGLPPSQDDYYPTVAISKLLRILKDPSLSAHHTAVVQAMVQSIFKSLGPKCIPFLPEVMPPLLASMRNCDSSFRKFLFQQLAGIVSMTKQHIRGYLPVIFELINEFWVQPYIISLISLVEAISGALKDEFKSHLPDLLPQILDAISYPITSGDVTIKVLQALESFGTQLSDYIHMVLPAVVRVFETPSTSVYVRRMAINIMQRLCSKLNFSDYSSRIIHPLARVLNEGGELTTDVMECLCALAYQLGSEFTTFVPMIHKVCERHRISHSVYTTLERKLLQNDSLLPEDINEIMSPVAVPEATEIQPVKNIKVNQANLRKVWDTSNKSTKGDWSEWLRKFSVELLRESPSPALRSCKNLAQVYPPLARELFNASFYSCWNELYDTNRDDLVQALETAMVSVHSRILQTLLNLAEFMEHDDKSLPISVSTLGELAVKCSALAKALRYKETEFREAPTQKIVASLISIYSELQQQNAAVGILKYSQKHHQIELHENWYEKLQRWNEALEAYDKKYQEDSSNAEFVVGRMRCQYALGEWERLSEFSKHIWHTPSMESIRHNIAPLAAAAAWNLGDWKYMEGLIHALDNPFNRSFYQALLCIHKDQYSEAQHNIDLARDFLDTSLTALVAESYTRAYDEVVSVQLLSELEEVIAYKQPDTTPARRKHIQEIWRARLLGAQPNVDVWQRLLSIRAMVCPPNEDLSTWLKFVSLCRKSGRFSIAQKVLSNLLGVDFNHVPTSMSVSHPRVAYAYLKHLWAMGSREEALQRLRIFVEGLDDADGRLQARCSLKLGEWQFNLCKSDPDQLQKVLPNVLACFKASTRLDKEWYKAWHMWALTNFLAISAFGSSSKPYTQVREFIFPAIHGFFRSIALAPAGQNLQDTLRLLTLWFDYGQHEDVQISINDGFSSVSINNWLQVIPQIIARIHTPVLPVSKMIHNLLARVGEAHPQALLYSLTVASKSQVHARKMAAIAVMDTLRKHSPVLVEQSQLVAEELIRVAILWPEIWHEGLEEASRQYFGDKNFEGMYEVLRPLHEMIKHGPETINEMTFHQQFGKTLHEALIHCQNYHYHHIPEDIEKAWELYYDVFRRIDKQLRQNTLLELGHISPKIEQSQDLSIAMPGTYKADTEVVRIKSFDPTLTVILSKQRPRKLTINGSDGKPYHFLLKGHEDLRQDERVMQLFGLVNTLLDSNLETAKQHLTIQRYSVCPLSPNSGLIGWVPLHDTLHALIREYRDSKKIVFNIEHRMMNNVTADYDALSLIQKIEVFEHVLDSTTGMDLDRILWLKSKNSETWLDRRTNYTRSLAVMSMVGYILGLGDRHPSNLMLHRLTGNILHIDFGDCFEVAMFREKFPEKIPFRLTRMLQNAMEVSGIEGNFRYTCERVMEVMRENKQSLMAVLEAFVHDPLLNWRLLNASPELTELSANDGLPRSKKNLPEMGNTVPEMLNTRAVQVVERVSAKLSGEDFPAADGEVVELSVADQVQRLIEQASSHENLCQCYVGWCPFW